MKTCADVMLAIISDSEGQEDGYDCFFSRIGDGIRVADVQRFHRMICENLEAIVLDEPVL